jgi:hypothetical protein
MAFFAFSPNLPSISPGEKRARSSRTCNRIPAGVGFVSERVLFEGSYALTESSALSAPRKSLPVIG